MGVWSWLSSPGTVGNEDGGYSSLSQQAGQRCAEPATTSDVTSRIHPAFSSWRATASCAEADSQQDRSACLRLRLKLPSRSASLSFLQMPQSQPCGCSDQVDPSVPAPAAASAGSADAAWPATQLPCSFSCCSMASIPDLQDSQLHAAAATAPAAPSTAASSFGMQGSTAMDSAETATPPPDTTKRRQQQSPDMMYTLKLLMAGGLAGAISKTATAPLARLTILYQVCSS